MDQEGIHTQQGRGERGKGWKGGMKTVKGRLSIKLGKEESVFQG